MDTPFNEVIKYTLEKIRPIIPRNTIKKFRTLTAFLTDVRYRAWSPVEIASFCYDRLTHHYKDIHNLCIMILQDFSISFQSGPRSFFAFTLNAWNIYEIFLRKIFEFQSTYHISAYSIKSLTEKVDWDNEHHQKLRPDIRLYTDDNKEIIIDAKYKTKKTQHDANQLYRYMGESPVKSALSYLIYPQSKEIPSDSVLATTLSDRVIEIRSVIIDLSKIRDEQYLKNFVSRIIDCNPVIKN